MIGRICGRLLEKQLPEVLVDVGGLGYEVLVPMSTVYALPALGENLVLHTHFVVREDAQQLYGFASLDERRLFRSLIKVNGVGPKMALAILSGIETEDFVRSVQDGETAALVKVPGVGKKTAERLIIEMRDRLKEWQVDAKDLLSDATGAIKANDYLEEAESALIALGYKPTEASKAVASANSSEITTSEALIRQALKNMVKR